MTFGTQIYGSDGSDARQRREMLKINGPRIGIIIRSIAKPTTGSRLIPGVGFSEHEALIDTGATEICIAPRTAKLLGLQAVNITNVGVVGGSVQATVYAGILEVPELHFSKVMEMYAPHGVAPSSQVLLGRSFLNHFIMTYNGPDGTFVFYSPTQQMHADTPDD